MMANNMVYRFMVRIAFVLFWLVLIAAFVYFSPIQNLFFTPKKSISVATWADYIDEGSVKEFESATGIKVYINFYENNEELLSKMELTKSKTYDLVIPTDSSVDLLIKKGMLKKLDKSKLGFWNELDPRLLGHYYDPKNEYSIPYYWDVMGIGYDKEFFKQSPLRSWALLFDQKVSPGHVGMTNDPREVILIAAQYLFGNIHNLDNAKLEQVKDLLLKQKAWVESYSDLRGEFLLYSKTSPVALIPSFQVWAGMRSGLFDNLGFLLPENPFMVIDSIAIPKDSGNSELVYQFINFLYQKKVLSINAEHHGFFAARKDLLQERDNSHIEGMENLSALDSFKSFRFFENVVSTQDLNKIWLTVKAA